MEHYTSKKACLPFQKPLLVAFGHKTLTLQ